MRSLIAWLFERDKGPEYAALSPLVREKLYRSCHHKLVRRSMPVRWGSDWRRPIKLGTSGLSPRVRGPSSRTVPTMAFRI